MRFPDTTVGRALVRRPGPRLAEGIVTHIDRLSIDVGHAFAQWQEYVAVLEKAGWEVIEVPPADDCPDAVFVEDTVVMYRGVAIVTNPGVDSRKPETIAVEELVRDLGCAVARITPPATLDGGDVLKVGDTVYVGRGGRTNAWGVRELRAIVEPLGGNVMAVPLTRVLHLKSAVSALPDGTFVAAPDALDEPSLFPGLRVMPEEPGGHVVLLDRSTLLMAASCPRSADLLCDLGYEIVTVDISEFEKLEGCVTCLSVRVRT